MAAGAFLEPANPGEITNLLRAWGNGDAEALNRLAPVVYDELRRIAAGYMRRESPDNSLQTTALVHEAYLKLVDARLAQWQDRAHFFAISARMMRRYSGGRSQNQGGGKARRRRDPRRNQRVPGWDAASERADGSADDALNGLAKFDPRKAEVVELRFFGGLSVEETAEVLKISAQSVMRDWKLARSWLAREMEGAG